MPTPTPLFVAGLGRSGTTALTQVLSSHPDIALGVERFKRLYPLDEPVSADLFSRARFFDFSDELTNLTPHSSPQWAKHYATMEAKWEQARYVGDKMVAIRLQHTWSTLPQARFVCIVRDIEPVAASWETRAQNPDDLGWKSNQDAMGAVKRWNRALGRIRRAVKQRPEHAVVVEYDRFFGDPAGQALGNVLTWLGLDRTDTVDRAFERAHRHFVDVVAPKDRALPPATLAFLDEQAHRKVWREVLDLAL